MSDTIKMILVQALTICSVDVGGFQRCWGYQFKAEECAENDGGIALVAEIPADDFKNMEKAGRVKAFKRAKTETAAAKKKRLAAEAEAAKAEGSADSGSE